MKHYHPAPASGTHFARSCAGVPAWQEQLKVADWGISSMSDRAGEGGNHSCNSFELHELRKTLFANSCFNRCWLRILSYEAPSNLGKLLEGEVYTLGFPQNSWHLSSAFDMIIGNWVLFQVWLKTKWTLAIQPHLLFAPSRINIAVPGAETAGNLAFVCIPLDEVHPVGLPGDTAYVFFI